MAKSVRLGETAERNLETIRREAERRLGSSMSDTQAAAFGFAELCRLWAGATLATFGAEEQETGEPPFAGIEAAMRRQHDGEQPFGA